jgi:hypothetical protein
MVVIDMCVLWTDVPEKKRRALPARIKGEIPMESVDLESREGLSELMEAMAREEWLGVRKDAVMKVDLRRCHNGGDTMHV